LNIVIGYYKELKKCLFSKKTIHPKHPFLIVHGGAGTGKSTLIKIVSQWTKKLLEKPGGDLDSPYVIAAPTGMAAANIGGSTLHTAFKLNFGFSYKYLSDRNRDSLRTIFKNVKLLIIDEFSMIKSDQLYQLHQTMCEIMQNDQPFGNVGVILFGDLMQLKPIKGG
jgi:ATP-dependent DNA helicase PIF1